MTQLDQRAEIFGWQDDVLLALADGKQMPWESLYSLPPWRAATLAQVAHRAGVIEEVEVISLREQAAKLGGTGYLPKRVVKPESLIAMHGDFGSGKDTVAERLVAEHGYTRLAFADQLKKLCEILDPVVGYKLDTQFYESWGQALSSIERPEVSVKPMRLSEVIGKYGWDEAKKRYPEVRRIQQMLATDVIRDEVDNDYWVNFVADQIHDGGKYVITDLRFPNEWELVDALGGQCWWIERPGHVYGADARAKSHISEAWHPPRYCKVVNGFDVGELWRKVDVAVTGGGFAHLEQLG